MKTIREREFIDQDHAVMAKYYDLCELEDGQKLKKELVKLIKKDPYFFDHYSHLYQILESEGKVKESLSILEDGHKKCLETILDKSGNWPSRLEWGWLENRHIIRMILNKAIKEWELENTESALGLLRKLLETNPNDNAGVRFYILAIKMGMSFEDYENRFNKGGHYEMDSWEWFDKNVKKFPEEFDAWMKSAEE